MPFIIIMLVVICLYLLVISKICKFIYHIFTDSSEEYDSDKGCFSTVGGYSDEKNQREAYDAALNNAKAEYEAALNGNNSRDALNKGRIYYALLRNGIIALEEDFTNDLSRRDEERIRLDLQTMNI